MKRILFVCLGNICRSSSAEEIMRTYIKQAGLEKEIEVDSAGISSYHEGERADDRMRAHAIRRGYNITHRSRPVRTDDFYDFDLILGMDSTSFCSFSIQIRIITPWRDKINPFFKIFCRSGREKLPSGRPVPAAGRRGSGEGLSSPNFCTKKCSW